MMDLLKSKKFMAACLGLVAVVVTVSLGKVGIVVTDTQVLELLAPVLAFILGQGIADHGKGAVEAKAKK